MSDRAFIFSIPDFEKRYGAFKDKAEAECAAKVSANPSRRTQYEEECAVKCERAVDLLLADMGREHIELSRQDFEAGDKGALLEALFKYVSCNRHEAMPLWIAKAIEHLYPMAVEMGLFASWDEVFGPPHPKNVKLPAKRAAFFKRWLVWVEFTELRKTMPRDDAFREAGKRHAMSYAKAKDLYYEAEAMLRSDDPAVAERARQLVEGAKDEMKSFPDWAAEALMAEAAEEYKVSPSTFARQLRRPELMVADLPLRVWTATPTYSPLLPSKNFAK